jgi:2-dehydropantoate 2-reductase
MNSIAIKNAKRDKFNRQANTNGGTMQETAKTNRIVVVGAGAIGGICAGLIKQAGFNVQAVCRNKKQAESIRSKGIHITGIQGDFHVAMPAVAAIEQITPDPDIVLFAVKATDMIEAAKRLVPLINESTLVVSLQNGLCEEALAEIFGKERVLGCVTGWGATLHSPLELEMTSTGEFVIGNLENKPDARLEVVKEILSCVVPCEISGNIKGSLYSKLIINSCITSVGGVCGLYLGEMLKLKQVRKIFFKIMEEAMDVAQAMGITVETYAGKLDYYSFLENKGLFSDIKRTLFLRILGFKFRKLKSSTLQSLERQQRTEIDFLTGYITGNGKKHNMDTPVNSQIHRMIKEIEAGERLIHPANLDEILLA